MKSKKPNAGLKNTSIGKSSLDECDIMISQFFQNEAVVKSFVQSSKKDGIPDKEIQKQLKYFGVQYSLLV